jgi:hypothetical protein
MEQDPRRTLKLHEQTIKHLLVRVMQMAKTLRAYYEQHQATGCTCSLCKDAEREFRKIEGTK